MPYANREDLYRAQRAHRELNKQKMIDYLEDHPCVDCGESDPVVLDFDHVSGNKSFSISRALTGSTRSWNSIMKEVEKCEVRCANCHRRITAKRSESTKYKHQESKK